MGDKMFIILFPEYSAQTAICRFHTPQSNIFLQTGRIKASIFMRIGSNLLQ